MQFIRYQDSCPDSSEFDNQQHNLPVAFTYTYHLTFIHLNATNVVIGALLLTPHHMTTLRDGSCD